MCVATLTDISGLNGVYKYDEYEIGRNGKLRVNLATGKAVYAINLLNSFDRKMPITIDKIIEALEKKGIIDEGNSNEETGQVKTNPDGYIYEIKEKPNGDWEVKYVGKGE